VLVVPTSVDYNAIACSPGLALVIDDVVAVRIESCKDAGAAGGTQSRGDEGIAQMHALPRE